MEKSNRKRTFAALTRAAKKMGCTWHMQWRTIGTVPHFAACLVDPYWQIIATRIAPEPGTAASRLTETVTDTLRNWRTG